MSADKNLLTPTTNLIPISPVDRQFHLLVQQLSIGLDVNPIIAGQPFYQANLNDIKLELPSLLEKGNSQQVFDYSINYPYRGRFLKAKYDLLKADKNKAHIHHWRHLQPIDENILTQNWQTRLDLWLITNQLKYDPSQVQITYWFITPFKLVEITLLYNDKLHREFTEVIDSFCSQSYPIKAQEKLNLAFQGQISWQEYIDSIPEYPI
ncbi:hypothetical protein PCC7424_5497 (plasmid) [Gloeothece citriformis PCC 7424]|uniref:Uncharacterized protein n=1 Tax=Gloeothece citriformis (strain PCC 7424) TaxID=65393 RepID=B7KMP4_GLOC7|nr:hypothetical protein [Gloeothece citriformis]ACK74066.1 hypothetical protein PCC7424_5497 [Gloeothece citriformis PCC 7424]